MNAQNAKDYLPLVQALADGKTIQHPSGADSWQDYPYDTNLTFELDARFYRVKPEPRTFEVWSHKYKNWIETDDNIEYDLDYWERITVQEVIK